MQYETIILELLSRIKKLEDDVSELKRAQEARNIAPAISACEDDTVEQENSESTVAYKKMTDEMR